jgi:TetR/AcrR family tetracycline transcriptional repressor
LPKPPTARRPASNRARSKADGALTRERIVAAAVQEIDARGLAAFSIRNLAARLGVYPTAIYWHIANRNLILAEVVGLILGDASPSAELGWRDFLRSLLGRYRTAIKAHPHVAPLVGAHLIGNASIPFAFVERLLAKLTEAGFEGEDLVDAYNTVIAALAGFITQEFAPVPEEGGDAWRAGVQERLLSVDAKACPILAANLPLLANRAFILRWRSGAEAPLDASFDRYAETVVAGLERFAEEVRARSLRP